MEMKKVCGARSKLDKTLASADLVSTDSLRPLIRNQLLRSSYDPNEGNIDHLVECRTREVSNILDMLKSASGNEGTHKTPGVSQNDWKIKQDSEQLRVLYREGLNGSPFHTFLLEGYLDGPLDICLCVSWETTLFRKWWPQYNVPPFKIVKSDCVKKVRIGEDISLIRTKVPWPVSEREAVLHYFEVEFLHEDLFLVVLKTISHEDLQDESSLGFSRHGIPDAGDVVRVDAVGGFVMQKVNDNRSYFRSIFNMDVKLDFVPPWMINFVARQLIGSGYKLFQKAVSLATTDEDYKKVLNEPLYTRVREYANNRDSATNHGEGKLGALLSGEPTEEHPPSVANNAVAEIVEEDTARKTQARTDQLTSSLSCGTKDLHQEHGHETSLPLSPEVEQALAILDTAITLVREKSPLHEKAKFALLPVVAAASHAVTSSSNTVISSGKEVDAEVISNHTSQNPIVIAGAKGHSAASNGARAVGEQVSNSDCGGRRTTARSKQAYKNKRLRCLFQCIPVGWWA